MNKPKQLRQAIENALPELKRNPDKLHLYITNGTIKAHKSTLSHSTHYTLSILITDFTGDQEILKTSIINWLQDHQPDLLQPGITDPTGISFEADFLGHSSLDLLIQLKLSERTTALIDHNNNVHITHPSDPNHHHLQHSYPTT